MVEAPRERGVSTSTSTSYCGEGLEGTFTGRCAESSSPETAIHLRSLRCPFFPSVACWAAVVSAPVDVYQGEGACSACPVRRKFATA